MLRRTVLVLGPALCAQPVIAATRSDEATLRWMKTEEWPRIYREQDVFALDRFLHDDFVVYDPSGVSTKAQEMAWVAKNRSENDGFKYEIQRLSIYGNTAIVAGQGVIRYASGNKPRTDRYRSTNVMLKTKGQWQAVASHVGATESGPLDA